MPFQGRDALFCELSDAAELAFATLAPPTPMLAERHAAGSAAYAPPAALPAEYMRGGGCFAPWATVEVQGKGATRLDAVVGGDRVRTADGGVAAVRCVVLTPCAGGRAVLVTLPGTSRLELTEWHPVLCGPSGRSLPLTTVPLTDNISTVTGSVIFSTPLERSNLHTNARHQK